ncbi:electron transport complex subunit E [Sedimentibacter sp. zth1]|uniref:electron transport complex subunit RsxE n=1 Tax=Sedimentibacter sp. zth1 TaxID=2816908 RepID=UPI001A92473E|nr:electron transport complex subunit E [Sedimentibacter sp. zth1]QSX06205.1 electron transport complex subunit E [Sedimentibacter sp. zth1]
MDRLKYIKNGIVTENPIFVQLLGMCPTLAITTSSINGMGMGLAVTAVLICSNAVISLIKNLIPDKIRIPAFIVVIATFVTLIDMLMHAYVPALYEQLGLFIPLIVVNCIILGRAEAFASKHGVFDSVCDGLGMGIGFTIALTLLGSVREILGAGSIFGFALFGEAFEPALIMIMPPGAFIALGLLIGLVNFINIKRKKA